MAPNDLRYRPAGDAIERVRREIGRAASERAMVKAMPPSAAEIKAQLTEEVRRLALKGTPSATFADNTVKLEWPDSNRFGGGAPPGAASALIAWLFGDQLLAALTRSVDQIAGISAAERQQRIADLEARILQLEHEEESLVEQALAKGLDIERRPGASGYALLGVSPVSELAVVAAE